MRDTHSQLPHDVMQDGQMMQKLSQSIELLWGQVPELLADAAQWGLLESYLAAAAASGVDHLFMYSLCCRHIMLHVGCVQQPQEGGAIWPCTTWCSHDPSQR